MTLNTGRLMISLKPRKARTASQYKFVLENANRDAFKLWVPRLIKALQQQPALKGVTSDL